MFGGSTGAAVTGEFRVNTATASTQDQPAVTALAGGGFAVGWARSDATLPQGAGSGASIARRIFVPQGGGYAGGPETIVNTYAQGAQNL